MLLRRNHLYVFQQKQSGAALILIAFLLALMAGAYMVKSLQGMTAQRKQDEKTMQALNEAKAALIAWSVSHQYTPGQMPWPDRGTDGNYDGSSDCVTTPFQNSYLLGQLPHLPTTSPCLDPNTGLNIYAGLSTYPGIGQEFLDAQGNRIWYAVSKNLVYDYETSTAPIINPGIANTSTWLKVLDRNGNLISDRVAVVLIAPGAPLPNQNRSGIAASTAYLDAFEIGLASYNNHTYAIAANEFVMGEDYKHVPDSDITFTKPYLFNDKLVFITIDEIIAAIEIRVAHSISKSLSSYNDTHGFFPYAVKLGGNKLYACITNNVAGILPVSNPSPGNATCNYNRSGSNVTSDCGTNGYANISAILFRKAGLNFSVSSGACNHSGRDCSCTGAGFCSRGTQIFQCDSNANCNTANSVSGEVRFLGGSFDTATKTGRCNVAISPAGDACQTLGMDVRCSGTGVGSVSRNVCSDPPFNNNTSQLPNWITSNRWHDYFYYASSRDGIKITAGISNLDAVLIGTKWPINRAPFAIKGSAQTGSGCDIRDYLDSNENTNGDATFEPITKQRNQSYNDKTYIVEP